MPKQKSDISGVPIGITYAGPVTWTIVKGVSIAASDAAVESMYAGSKLVNDGVLQGGEFGVRFFEESPSAGFVIENRGTIAGGKFGILVLNEGTPTKVTNAKGAEITGSDNIAIGFGGAFSLKNEGKIKGDVLGETNQDSKVVNKGTIKGDVYVGSGDDVFQTKGKGKAGIVDLGAGNDTMVFGSKADSYQFSSTLDASTNVDRLKKFESGKDKLILLDGVFGALDTGSLPASAFRQGKAAKDGDDHIIYDKKTGALYYDPDGVGGAAQVQFAKLDKGAKLKASDFTVTTYDFLI